MPDKPTPDSSIVTQRFQTQRQHQRCGHLRENCEAHAFFNSDGVDQRYGHLDAIARHHHFSVGTIVSGERIDGAGHVSGTHVELRTVAGEERSVTSAFFLLEDVNLGLELGCEG